jgi:hypothetical protein
MLRATTLTGPVLTPGDLLYSTTYGTVIYSRPVRADVLGAEDEAERYGEVQVITEHGWVHPVSTMDVGCLVIET